MGEDVLMGLQMETLTTLDTNTGSGLLENACQYNELGPILMRARRALASTSRPGTNRKTQLCLKLMPVVKALASPT